ncbi:hypothetical protein LOZ66_001176 [Ophidiomyces ophidiicola]|nr:hypothetical protein LOZ66_001176 [Ophidiomyces ophidiicola]
MSSVAVIERRNKQIQDAVEGGNLKQALQLCEKRLKKGENTAFLKAWKANILSHHADSAHRDRGVSEALQLCNSHPTITDIDALDMLQNTLGGLDVHAETLRTVWQNAAKAMPQDEDIQAKWFTLASEAGDWKTAQKAAMGLQINFPKVRKYYFWAIFMCYLLASDPKSLPADKQFFGTLAYRMISKAADSVPRDPKELLSPARAIQTPEELFLLVKIYTQQGRYSDIVNLLNSAHLGVKSRIAQNDWSLVTTKLATLEKAGLWEQGMIFAKELLALPDTLTDSRGSDCEEKDDWQVWKLLLTSAEKLSRENVFREVRDFIDTYISKRPKSRNAQLARLDLISLEILGNKETPTNLLAGCKAYFDRNKNKLYCFHDIRSYLGKLDESLQKDFHTYVLQHVCIKDASDDLSGVSDDPFQCAHAINALKLEFCFQLLFDSSTETDDFACRCFQWLRACGHHNTAPEASSTLETKPTDDFYLLASMSLIHPGGDNPVQLCFRPTARLIQAAGIIEHLLLKSPHNYEALLLLVRIYLLLGAGSLALKTFSQLSVKQFQYETVAHNLFTRISTVHPQAAPPFESLERKDFDPQTGLRQALVFYRNAIGSITYARATGLDHGSYMNVAGSIDLQNDLKYSICRKMWALEVRKIQRLVGGPSVQQYDSLVSEAAAIVDKRNSNGFLNCERPGHPMFETHLRLGPLPKERAVKAMVVTDMLLNYLFTDSSLRGKLIDRIANLACAELDLADTELTHIEIENIKIHHLLLKLVSSIAHKSSASNEGSEGMIYSQIESWAQHKAEALTSSSLIDLEGVLNLTPSTPSASSPVPSWLYIHANISLLETLKAISLLVSSLTSQNPDSIALHHVSKDRLDALKLTVKDIADIIRTNTRILKRCIAEPGVLGQLVSVITTGPLGVASECSIEIGKLIDTPSLELFCGSLMESWDEALDGVVSICSNV